MLPKIAITMGDFNGIGPEIIIKCLKDSTIRKICKPFVIGSIDVFEYYASKLKEKCTFTEIDSIPEFNKTNQIFIFNLRDFQFPIIRPSSITKEAGEYAGEAIEIAVQFFKHNLIDGIITAPVSKEALNKSKYRFPGQTEMLSSFFDNKEVVMMLVSKNLRVGLVTTHLPLSNVAKDLSKEKIINKISVMHSSLKKDFIIRNPKIVVLGLNPHAGENGNLGKEENNIIIPAIKYMRRKGIFVDGPFPADGFWGTNSYKKYDAVLAMYHDQGLIPFKMSGFDIGVNFTAGLPVVRTSPDHGTAFDIAGKGIANPSSMIEAIKLAVKIINNRKRKIK